MGKSRLFLIALVLLFGFIEHSIQHALAPTCFGQVCPSSTASCKEYKKSSDDRSKIQVKITCLDDFDASVKEYYFEEPSHLDRHTFYENTRYESINEGLSRTNGDPFAPLDLTPQYRPEYF